MRRNFMLKITGKISENGYEIEYKATQEKEAYIDIQVDIARRKEVIEALKRIIEFLEE